MPDLKKLISSFLLLATLTSSGSFFLSRYFIGYSQTDALESGGATGPLIANNAFIEPIPNNNFAPIEMNDGLPPLIPSSNLTDNMAQAIARQLVAANPDGPLSANNSVGILPPDSASLDALIAKSLGATATSAITPTTDISEKSLNIFVATSPTDISQYNAAIRRIFENEKAIQSLDALAARTPSVESINATELVVSQVRERLLETRVPSVFIPFHKKALITYSNISKSLRTLASYENDPVKAMLAAQTFEIIIADNVRAMNSEYDRIRPILSGSHTNNSISNASLFDSLFSFFGIPTAFAQVEGAAKSVPVDSPPGLAPLTFSDRLNKWLQFLFEWARTTGTETLRNQITHRFVEQIIQWVKGGGKPQFVTDWKGFLGDAANDAAGAAIESVLPELCSSLRNSVRIATLPVQNARNVGVRCTLDRVVENIREFRDDFSSGGWVAYGAAIQPSNNLFGSIIITRDIAIIEAQKAKEAEKSDAESGAGFLSTRRCVKRMSVDEYAEREGLNYTPSDVEEKDLPCVQYETTTPGKQAAELTTKALGAPLERVINAEDLTALVSAVVDSFTNKLILAGVDGIVGATTRPSNPTPNTGVDPCKGLTGASYSECRGTLSTNSPDDIEPQDYAKKYLPTDPDAENPQSPTPRPDYCARATPPPICSEFTGGTSPTFNECVTSCFLQ